MFRRTFLATSLAALATQGRAAPLRYGIGPKGATITYLFTLQGTQQRGTAPLARADLTIDPQNLARSTADVAADIRKAKTGFLFITDALKSPQVLDAETHPMARFRSTRITLGQNGRLSNGARVAGDLTLRGVTRAVELDATLFREPGSAPDDLSRLSVRLKGTLSRTAFGATGYPKLVDDRVDLDIEADIVRM